MLMSEWEMRRGGSLETVCGRLLDAGETLVESTFCAMVKPSIVCFLQAATVRDEISLQ
jgi:hypothetical protein